VSAQSCVDAQSYPFPPVRSVIDVLWDYDEDWWRTGTVVAWNEEKRQHEVAYHDEPDEEPVLERFWGKSPSRYRYTGEEEVQPASAAPKTSSRYRHQCRKRLTQDTNTAATTQHSWNITEEIIEPKNKYYPVMEEHTVHEEIRPTLNPDWWDNAYTWEMPHYSRSQWPLPPIVLNVHGEQEVLDWYYKRRVQEVNIVISRQIVMRCLAGYRHEVGQSNQMVVAQMDSHLWDFWKHVTLQRTPCDKVSCRKVGYPDVGYTRYEEIESLYWKSSLPILDGQGWHRMKTVNASYGTLYRSQVLWLKLFWNSWTHLIRVEFDYEVERFDDENKVWRTW